ncbi:hypothetical protein [Donghicola tyrosinivorans]|uniref:Uncharacterized protein n=1 Tax=Donghicola tyrosinivorans TaxID=1652492 RepID=A0A2T0X5X5_9RHOB|nr:hypothetical protein [Donghicola tyrosinivorans]PRY94348.1 hypothetical protein CLV74_101487 [Donghicola tyrosinivorans]
MLHPVNTPAHTNYATLGSSFAEVLAALPGLSDAAASALPAEWNSLASLLWTLIEDEGHSTETAAHEAGVPASLVRDYRRLTGL